MPQYAKVSGVINGGAGSTFQTGDTINGSGSTNTLNLIETANNGVTTASVTNVGTINHTNVSGVQITVDESLYSGVTNENVVKGVNGSRLTLTNASAGTTFGVSSGVADRLDVTFTAGTTNATLNLNLAGAGATATAGGQATITSTTAGQVKTVNIATVGTNNVNFSGSTATSAINVTGAGNNTLTIAAGAAAAALTVDASAATGNQIIDLGSNFSLTDVIKGTTGTSTTTLGIQLTGVNTAPTNWTNVDALLLDNGSTGTLFMTGLTSIGQVVNANLAGSTATLTNLGQLNSLVFEGNGAAAGAAINFGGLTINGASLAGTADSVAITFDNLGVARATADALSTTALGLNGVETITVNTAGGVGSTGTFTLGALQDNTLQSFTITNASTGLTTLAGITAGTGAANAGTLLTFNASGLSGALTATFAGNSLANGALVTGTAANNILTFNADNGAASIVITTGAGNDQILAAAGSTSNYSITSGNGNDTIVTGAGVDTISVGNGSNSITAGGAADAITLATHTGNADTILYTAVNQGGGALTIAAGGALAAGDVVTGFAAGAGANDVINVNAATTSAVHAGFSGATIINTVQTTAGGNGSFFISTGQTLAGAAPTIANVNALIGTVTTGAGDSFMVAFQTNVASNVWDVFQVVSVNARNGAALATTDTISLVGQYTTTTALTIGDIVG